MQKIHVLVYEDSLCPIKLPDVSGPGLGEAGRYRMVSEPTLAVSRARTGISARACGRARSGSVREHLGCAVGTGRTGRGQEMTSWLGIDRQECRSLKGVRM